MKISQKKNKNTYIVVAVLIIIGLILMFGGIAIMRSSIIEGLTIFFVGCILGFIGVGILEW
ncbi:MAG: hypothetical protein ACFE8L_08670 [Candidatus Hodarchaeota archaeon]